MISSHNKKINKYTIYAYKNSLQPNTAQKNSKCDQMESFIFCAVKDSVNEINFLTHYCLVFTF